MSVDKYTALLEPNPIDVLSAFLGRGADRRWIFGALEPQ